MTVAAIGATLAPSVLVGRLITAGAQRLGSMVFQKVCRVVKIDQALRTGVQRNPNIQKAINDFETVIGSRYGALTEQLDAFFRELERTGLLSSMFEHALLGRDSTEVKALFINLHNDVLGKDEGDASTLYDKLLISFSITIQETAKDRILLDALQFHYSEIESRLSRVDDALASINQRLRANRSKLDFSDLSSLLLKVARNLQSSYRSIRVETNKGARLVDITKIYIPCSLRYRASQSNARKIEAGRRFIKEPAGFAHGRSERDALDNIKYIELRTAFNRVVILGDPGGGKSTLCQNLCYDLAKQATSGLVTAIRSITGQLQKFPIKIVLRQFEKARTLEPQLTIYDFVLRDWANYINATYDELRIALDHLISTGTAVLVFDGLDEILVPARRREYVDLVLAFCNQYPLCPVVVTSRLVGYDDAPLSDDFDELVLERFNDHEVREYAEKFFKVVGGHSAKEAAYLAGNFIRQTTQNAADLRKNPLMLGLMTWIFNSRRDVPSNRPEIYRECAILMFERWDPDRDIKADIPSDFDRLQLFSELASKIYGHPELSGGVEISWLEKQTRLYFERVYENRARAFQSAKALVSFITGRAWVMSEIGDRIFGFTHQTFLEYFFAHHLDEQTDSVAALYDRTLPKFSHGEWDMVSHLALQIKTYRNLRKQNESIELLRRAIEEPNAERNLFSIVSFAARALEYLAGSESEIRALLQAIFAIVLASDGASDVCAAFSRCSECALERREFVHNTMVELIVRGFKEARPERLERLIGNSETDFESTREGLPEELRARVRQELHEFVSARADKDAYFAKKAWEWYGLINRSLVAKFGLAVYFDSNLAGISNVDGLTGTMLCASRAYNGHYRGGPITQKMAREALAIFGAVGLDRLPLERRLFRPRHGSAPVSVWADALSDFTKSQNILVGACFCMAVVAELTQQEERRAPSAARNLDLRGLNEKALRKNNSGAAVKLLEALGSDSIFDTPSP